MDNNIKTIIHHFIEKGFLISPLFVEKMSLREDIQEKLNFLSEDEFEFLTIKLRDNIEKKRISEKGESYIELIDIEDVYNSIKNEPFKEDIKAQSLSEEINYESGSVQIVFSYKENSKKRDIQDFVSYFNHRYKSLEKLLHNRQELQNIISISRLKMKKDREVISIIGLVVEKHITKNKNILLTLEDASSQIKVIVNKSKPDIYSLAMDIVEDEVIGIIGVNNGTIIFANNIVIPDIPLNKEIKKSHNEEYAIFLSDLHVGSNKFLPEEFERFLKWIKGEAGNEKQKEIAEKIKYIFIVGDLVDGIGIYPEQNSELVINDIYQQYTECARLLRQIPTRIKLIICPGNHDAMRIAEPQPQLYKDFACDIWALPNVVMISNPGIVNIGATKDFPGFDILLYHGYSFDYFVANVDSIRKGGGYDRADLIMKFLMQRRHLAPTHTSTLYIPDANQDCLVIEKVPDFFITGHIHKCSVSNYRNVTMICGSCWQAKTSFQEKVGHHPEPARVPIVNLQTRKVTVLRFGG